MTLGYRLKKLSLKVDYNISHAIRWQVDTAYTTTSKLWTLVVIGIARRDGYTGDP